MPLPRLRQVACVVADLAAGADRLRTALDLPEPFRDEGVAQFGLDNAVFAVGDTFLELVAPVAADTAAGRYHERRGGDCGYMALFQVEDAGAARRRLADLGVRVVFTVEHPDIVDLHLHPRDVPGAIVALDAADPPGSWRWGGPTWTGRVPAHPPGGITGLTVAAADPARLAARWAEVLGLPAPGGSAELSLDGGRQTVHFVAAPPAGGEGIVGLRLDWPDGRQTAAPLRVAGVEIARTAGRAGG